MLISIQGLILVPDPFFGEPGNERLQNTPQGEARSRLYNQSIREGTLKYAILGQIKSPPVEMRSAVVAHFLMRREALIEQVAGWATDPQNSRQHRITMERLLAELEEALGELEGLES